MPRSIEPADTRLATYGSLAPGCVNEMQLEDLKGLWRQGTVKGRLIAEGWGAPLGYPGLILDPAGQDIDVFVFESLDLPDHWPRLDAFEGEGYRRVVTQVRLGDDVLEASIYVIDPRSGPA